MRMHATLRHMRQLVFLGTAAGMPFASNSSALLIESSPVCLLLDTSGGYTIFRAFHDTGRDPLSITHIFISHHDADHILGIVPLVRLFSTDTKERTVYCSRETKAAIDAIFTHTARRHFDKLKDRLHFEVLSDGQRATFDGHTLTAFDLNSSKTPQLGCSITFPDQKRIVFTGDEPLKEHCLGHATECDILIHEAACTSDTVKHFKPYEKQQGTARGAGHNAAHIGAGTLALFHMEDETLATRKEAYLADVLASGFGGNVFVPMDYDALAF